MCCWQSNFSFWRHFLRAVHFIWPLMRDLCKENCASMQEACYELVHVVNTLAHVNHIWKETSLEQETGKSIGSVFPFHFHQDREQLFSVEKGNSVGIIWSHNWGGAPITFRSVLCLVRLRWNAAKGASKNKKKEGEKKLGQFSFWGQACHRVSGARVVVPVKYKSCRKPEAQCLEVSFSLFSFWKARLHSV